MKKTKNFSATKNKNILGILSKLQINEYGSNSSVCSFGKWYWRVYGINTK